MLSLAETTLEGAEAACDWGTGVEPVVVAVSGVDVAPLPQATSANTKKMITPVIGRRKLRFGFIDIFMIFASPVQGFQSTQSKPPRRFDLGGF